MNAEGRLWGHTGMPPRPIPTQIKPPPHHRLLCWKTPLFPQWGWEEAGLPKSPTFLLVGPRQEPCQSEGQLSTNRVRWRCGLGSFANWLCYLWHCFESKSLCPSISSSGNWELWKINCCRSCPALGTLKSSKVILDSLAGSFSDSLELWSSNFFDWKQHTGHFHFAN